MIRQQYDHCFWPSLSSCSSIQISRKTTAILTEIVKHPPSTATTMAFTTDSPTPQDTQQPSADNAKRLRSKSVTWAAEDELNQVRLFAAEDAPSLSGLVLQDLLEAKKSKFMHALVPVSAEDLPPGFEGVATKRARLDTSAVLVMVTQISWRYPQRFLYDPSWQVAIGDESSEKASQAHREVRVLEAVYPRFTAIPFSSTEPPEAPPQTDDSQVLQIPLIPIEDEEEGTGDDYVTGNIVAISQDSSGNASLSYPPGYSPPREDKYVDIGGQPRSSSGSSSMSRSSTDFTTKFVKIADPDVAAAAAAAYAVLKAKESGKLIDQDLLVNILSNPLLIETLTASNPSLKNQFGDVLSAMPPYRENVNGNGFKGRPEPFDDGAHVGGGLHAAQVIQGRQRYETTEGKIMSGLQGNPMTPVWGLNPSTSVNSQGRGFPPIGSQDQLNTGKIVLGPMKGTYGAPTVLGNSYSLPRQDSSRELLQQHGIGGMLSADAQLRQGAPPGSKGQPWLPNNVLSAGAASRNTATSQDRPIVPKSRRQCFFYNTPKGCRNGIFCSFSHDSVPDRPYLERTNSDTNQQERISRMESSSDTVNNK